jgi:hypothetical protein
LSKTPIEEEKGATMAANGHIMAGGGSRQGTEPNRRHPKIEILWHLFLGILRGSFLLGNND